MKFWQNRKVDMKKVYYKRLQKIEWSNPKEAAYELTFLGRELCKDAPRVEEIYKQLLPLLDAYKYRKEVPAVDAETMKHYNLLVHLIDELL